MSGFLCNKQVRIIVLAIIFIVITSMFSFARKNELKVGVYENEPLVFRDRDGKYSGLSIDVLEYVAAKEGWDLEYVHGTLSECIARVEKGDIDIQTVIGYSKDRARGMDFTDVTLFSNWGQIYTRPGLHVESILDLEGRSVVLVKGTIYGRAFREMIDSLGISSDIKEAEDYPSILSILDAGAADAGVLNRSFAEMKSGHFKAGKTSIIFHPIETRYAFPKGKNEHIRRAIDEHLSLMIEDKDSVYHRSFDRYFGGHVIWKMSGWLMWAVATGAALLVLSISIAALLRYKVRQRTVELTAEISERKKAEEELKRNREHLEETVAERTEELIEANKNLQLEISKRRIMEEEILKVQKLEAIGKLAGGIAHDFNNILTAIMNNLYLLRTAVSTEEKAYVRLEAAEKGVRKATALTKQLLTFSKGGEPVKEILSIAGLLSDATTFALRGSNVRCELDVPDDLWTVEADSGLLEQAINNIVMNSDQAMPDGGVIRISAENITASKSDELPLSDGRYVRISIRDTGVGIPDENTGKIFDPYFTTKEKGSGLGLAAAYSIINKHEGHITVESKAGVGTTFHVYLPASDKDVVSTIDAEISAKAAYPANVLLMEDELLIAESTAMGLEGAGYKVRSAIDGSEAVEMYKSAMENGSPFDLVILDLTIPGGMGGKDTINSLREIDPDVKAIVASGYSDDPIMSNFRDYGFLGVIEKPYEINEMVEVIKRFVSDKQQSDDV